MTALKQGGVLALANKESLVTAGPLMLATARAHGATVLPVDSEHSAVFQALRGEEIASVERIIITASGGPFRDWPLERMARGDGRRGQPASELGRWGSGSPSTRASMFNKALELIETHEFFGIDPRQDRGPRASRKPGPCAGRPCRWRADCASRPARHAPRHRLCAELARTGRRCRWRGWTWPRIGRLTFEPADETRFPALRLAREVMAAGGLAGAAFNAAKEAALDLFLARRLPFLGMAALVERVLERLDGSARLGIAEHYPR